MKVDSVQQRTRDLGEIALRGEACTRSSLPDCSSTHRGTHAVANYKQRKALRITFRVFRFPATTLGQRIRKRRLEMDLKQVELAALLGVNPGTIVNWEKDRTKPGSPVKARLVKTFLECEIGFGKNLIGHTRKRSFTGSRSSDAKSS